MKKTTLLITTVLLTFTSMSFGRSFQSYINGRIQQLQNQYHPKIGIIIAKTNGKILYSKNAQQHFASASIMKLFTASAATLCLGPSFRYKTTLETTGKIQAHTLTGNAYIHFTGDPGFSLNSLRSLFVQLKTKGVNEIHGNLYLDNTLFNQIAYSPGTTIDDISYSYASPINAMTINENQFALSITPQKNHKKPKLTTALPKGAATFSNQIITTRQYIKTCPLVIQSTDNNYYKLSGCMSQRGKRTLHLAIRNVAKLSTAQIKAILKALHIKLTGQIKVGKMPGKANIIAKHYSSTLSLIIREMLKESDNLISNNLVKTISSHHHHNPGNFQSGLKAIQKKLHHIANIDFRKSIIRDGAGLSRYNLITPKQVLKLLIAINKNVTLKRNIISSLPIAGIDGTLRKRMKILAKRSRLKAKTGTLSGVSNLAGFIKTKHHGNLIFVILINQYVTKASPIQRWTDRLLTHVALK